MVRSVRIFGTSVVASGLALALSALIAGADAKDRETVLYSFAWGSDGATPLSGLTADGSANLYGTTWIGGGTGCSPDGCGTVFRLAPDGTETVLYSFRGGNDGFGPLTTLLADSSGNFYGTTTYGGGKKCGGAGCGIVFKLAPDGTETVLHSFTGLDGENPEGGPIADRAGNLYGTTATGGASGNGTVFRLAPNGTETVLYAFQGGNDGAFPTAGVIADRKGNLYGTTNIGAGTGCGDLGCGAVFKLTPGGTETLLHAFTGGNDGGNSSAGLIADRSGNLFGTTEYGGTGDAGVVFRLSPDGTETVLYSFTGGSDGGGPSAGVIMDGKGNLYGTTEFGGRNGCDHSGCGTVFKLAPNGTETVLYAFRDGRDGASPRAGLTADKAGNLYGAAPLACGHAWGCVFKVTK